MRPWHRSCWRDWRREALTAYYNEFDPKAAAVLRELIKAGLIAPGDVDERSIEDVVPAELVGYTQCHFFAGFGVWSYALRRAGWSDDRAIWSASCPCQPFSQAGEGAGFADERHLWPHLYHLIGQRRPGIVVGEQVASKDADPWVDLVQTDLEAVAYAFGAAAFPSAGVGAPHIRDRTYWVAHTAGQRLPTWPRVEGAGHGEGKSERPCLSVGMADAQCVAGRCQAESADHDWSQADRPADRSCGCGRASCRMADDTRSGRREEHAHAGWSDVGDRSQGLSAGLVHGGGADRVDHSDQARLAGYRGSEATGGRPEHGLRIAGGSAGAPSNFGGLVHADGWHAGAEREQRSGEQRQQPEDGGRLRVAPGATFDADSGAGPTNGLWRDADWLFCRDGKWRPVESRPQPLVDGSSCSLGRVCDSRLEEIEGEVNAWSVESQVERAEAMRNLLVHLGTQTRRCWATGRLPGLHEAPFLLAFMRQLQEQGWRVAEGVALPREEAADRDLRVLWSVEEIAGAPCERGLEGQPTGEPSDAVRFLSRLLARHASEAWADAYAAHAEIGFPLTTGAQARVARLRGFGNAINAEAAKAFIEAVMETTP